MKPFKPARLYDADGDITKRWYISFYAWSEKKNKLQRKKDYDINKYKTEIERRAFAELRIAEINKLLAGGMSFKMEDVKPIDLSGLIKATVSNQTEQEAEILNTTTIKDAFELILELKEAELTKESHKKVRQVRDSFLNFFNTKKKPYPSDYTELDIIAYSDHLILNEKKSAKTRNDNIQWLKHVFGHFKKRGWVKSNPVLEIGKMKVNVSKKNRAFSSKQVAAIKAKADPQLWLSILFLYYCFMRRKETRLIKIKHIRLQDRQIFIPSSNSKNKKDAYLVLPHLLLEELEKMDLDQYPDEYYLFGKTDDKSKVIPNDTPFSENVMYNRHTRILKELDLYGKDYTFYSWKHTGVVHSYKDGLDIKSIQLQCRHHSLEVTDIYLKSLGLYQDADAFSVRRRI